MPGNRRVALLAMEPNMPDGEYTPFSFGVRRIQASLLSDPTLEGVEVHLAESKSKDVDAWVAEVESIDADVVGMSTYVWSFPTFVDVARRLKRARPDRTVVFGGPSARPAMFGLAPWRDAGANIDALVSREGEMTFRSLVRLADRTRDALRAVPGLHLSGGPEGWATTGEAPLVPLDDIASPARMGLLPPGRTVAVETYRGCPLSCSFCQWGELETPDRIFSEAYLTAELEALRALRAPSAQLVDAALNLNSRAFRNLAAAEKKVGFFKNAQLFCPVYPMSLNEQHLEFLAGVSRACLDVGLQSLNKEALENAQRPFRESQFAKTIEDLSKLADVEVELILGLPGDSPAAFRRTLDRARELPCKVRIFHCLVLPDALMTRAPPSFELRFDPYTLMMRSCLGWSEDGLARERSRLIEMAYREGGEITPDMWSFPGPREAAPRRRLPASIAAGSTPEITGDSEQLAPAGSDLQRVLEQGIREATSGGWTFVEASSRPGELVVIMKTRDGALVVEMRPASPTEKAYKVVEGVAFGYRSPRGARMSDGALRLLDRVLTKLHAPARAALGLSGQEGGPTSARVRRLPITPT